MNSEYILGVRVDIVNHEEALQKIEFFLSLGSRHVIFTPNPEMIVDAQSDIAFMEALNSGELNICDGKGLQLVSKNRLTRIAGVDLLNDICKVAEKLGKRVYLFGTGDQAVVSEAARRLRLLFQELIICGYDKGPKVSINPNSKKMEVDPDLNDSEIVRINAAEPDILIVAFGHNKQEKWIVENLSKLLTSRLIIGIGGGIDYLAGRTHRAPIVFQRLGLEWLWRLIMEPWRIKRTTRATIIFLYYYVKSKFKNKNAQVETKKIQA